MSITYRFSWEHPVFKAITFCLMIFSGFAIYVALMSAGRYGYTPSLPFYTPIFLLLLVKGFKARLFQSPEGEFVLIVYNWYGFKLGTQRFEKSNLKKSGKFYFLKGVVAGRECSTYIVYDSFGTIFKNENFKNA